MVYLMHEQICCHKFKVIEMPGDFHLVEAFGGQCEIAKAFKRAGLKACALDINLDPRDETGLHACMIHATVIKNFDILAQDILSPIGFVRHLYSAANLCRGGLLTAAVVCSSWVAINRISPCSAPHMIDMAAACSA